MIKKISIKDIMEKYSVDIPSKIAIDNRLDGDDIRVLIALYTNLIIDDGKYTCTTTKKILFDLTGICSLKISEIIIRLEGFVWIKRRKINFKDGGRIFEMRFPRFVQDKIY